MPQPEQKIVNGETVSFKSDSNYAFTTYQNCTIQVDVATVVNGEIKSCNFSNVQFTTCTFATGDAQLKKIIDSNLTNADLASLTAAGVIRENCNEAQGVIWE